MTEHALFHAQAARMALIQAAYIREHLHELHPETVVLQAVNLVRDWIRYLGRRDLAIVLALEVHPVVERWAMWDLWASTLDELLHTWQSAESEKDRARLLNYHSQCMRELGDLVRARSSARAALELAERCHDQALMAATLNKLGRIAICQDDIDQAQRFWEQAHALAERAVLPLDAGHISMNLGVLATVQGRVFQAAYYFDDALHQYQRIDDAYHIAKLHCNRADLAARSERLIDVPLDLFAARDIFRDIGARYDYGLAENDIGSIYLRLHQYEPAYQALQTARSVFEELNALGAQAIVLSNLGELLVTMEDWDQADSILTAGHELAAACERPLLMATIDVDRGRMLAARGDVAGAARLWQAALAIQEMHGVDEAQRTRALLTALHSRPDQG